ALHGRAMKPVRLTNLGRAMLRVRALPLELDGQAGALSSAAEPPFVVAPEAALPLALPGGSAAKVQVEFVPAGAGQVRGVLRVVVDDELQQQVQVDLRAEAVDAQARISP